LSEEQNTPAGKIWAALARAQGQMRVPTKDSSAKVQMKAGGSYSYSYASLGEILRCVVPALSEAGIALHWGIAWSGSNLAVSLELRCGEDGSSTAPVVIPCLVQGDRAQDLGSAITYARRYALTLVCGVAADDDDDASAADGIKAETAKRTSAAAPAQAAAPIPAVRKTFPSPGTYGDFHTQAAAAGLSRDEASGVMQLHLPMPFTQEPKCEAALWELWPPLASSLLAMRRREVPSEENPRRTYTLERAPGGKWACTCEAGRYGKDCRHARLCEVDYVLAAMPATDRRVFDTQVGAAEDKTNEAIRLAFSWMANVRGLMAREIEKRR